MSNKVTYLPNFGFEFADTPESDNSDKKLSINERLAKLQKEDNELFSAIFGKGIVKGKKEVTDDYLNRAQDERFEKVHGMLRNERITRVLKDKAKDIGFFNPEDVIDFLGHSLTLDEDGEVVDKNTNEKTNIDDALDKLAKRSPHLVASKQKPGQGSKPSAPNRGSSEKPKFKRSQLRDSAFYKEHESEIMEAVREHRIIDDLKDTP